MANYHIRNSCRSLISSHLLLVRGYVTWRKWQLLHIWNTLRASTQHNFLPLLRLWSQKPYTGILGRIWRLLLWALGEPSCQGRVEALSLQSRMVLRLRLPALNIVLVATIKQREKKPPSRWVLRKSLFPGPFSSVENAGRWRNHPFWSGILQFCLKKKFILINTKWKVTSCQ